MTVFITTTFPVAQQGLAGGVINSVLQLGVAVTLGLADIVQSSTVRDVGLATSYKNTFWFGVVAGALSLVLLAVWGEVPKATSRLTAEEEEELVREAEAEAEVEVEERRRGAGGDGGSGGNDGVVPRGG